MALPLRFGPVVLLSSLVLFFTSCTVASTVTLGTGASAQVRTEVTLQPAALAAWKELRDLDATLPADPLDQALWKQSLGASAQITRGNPTVLSFQAEDLTRRLPGLRVAEGRWDLSLDRAGLKKLLEAGGWGKSEALAPLLPAPGAQVSAADYRDLLVYLLGTSVTEAAGRTLVDQSQVQLTLVTPRPVVSAVGAVVQGNRATWTWRLAEVAALEKPVVLSLRY